MENKEIETMACILTKKCKSGCATCSILSEYGCAEYESAKKLQEVGYGNIKKAVKEFAEKLKSMAFYGYDNLNNEQIHAVDIADIDELIKKLENS